ncbi:hypothetical protein EYF80_062445 [Liparis tanakae]|uniref:Uncharacterized protein n=1 Tax=Liparis tanakae TaxID=230148 RepID=A0A4Z2EFU0_9TELE|nr:hypothetical protein EYF80_062445 [Liparis tanakae]
MLKTSLRAPGPDETGRDAPRPTPSHRALRHSDGKKEKKEEEEKILSNDFLRSSLRTPASRHRRKAPVNPADPPRLVFPPRQR